MRKHRMTKRGLGWLVAVFMLLFIFDVPVVALAAETTGLNAPAGNGADPMPLANSRVSIVEMNGAVGSVVAPAPVDFQVLVDGATVQNPEDWEFYWYIRYANSQGKMVWDSFKDLRGNDVMGPEVHIPATLCYTMGYFDLYCQVTDDNAIPVSPMPEDETDTDPATEPMIELDIVLEKVSVVVATETEIVAVSEGDGSKSVGAGGSISVAAYPDQKMVLVTVFSVTADASNGTPWMDTALSIEIPDDDTVEMYENINIVFSGENTFKCHFRKGALDAGTGSMIEAPGTHSIAMRGKQLTSTGGLQGIYLGGGDGNGESTYRIDGLTLIAENHQEGMHPFAAAMAFSRSSGVFSDAKVTLRTNSKMGLSGFYKKADPYTIIIGPGTDMKVQVLDQVALIPDEAIPLIVAINSDTNVLTIDNAKVSIEFGGTMDGDFRIIGMGAAGVDIMNGAEVSITSKSPDWQDGAFFGIFTGGVVNVLASKFTVDAEIPAGQIGEVNGIVARGGMSVTDGSTVTMNLKSPVASAGIDVQGDGVAERTMLVRDSDINITVQAGNPDLSEAIGILADRMDITETGTHRIKVSTSGGLANIPMMAVRAMSDPDPENYTPGYQAQNWKLNGDTQILFPVVNELNLGNYETYYLNGYNNGEVVYGNGNTTTPESTVEIGVKQHVEPQQPATTIGASPQTGDNADVAPPITLAICALAAVVVMAVYCRRGRQRDKT